VPEDPWRMNAAQHGRAESDERQRAWVVVAGMAVLLAVGACTPGANTRPLSPIPGAASATPSPTVTSSPSTPDPARYPNLSSFSDPFDRLAYKLAYSDCRLIGVVRAAEAWGGDPDDPSSVASGYAVTNFPTSHERRGASFRGCLDAFGKEAG
jgi:hypothetical protein